MYMPNTRIQCQETQHNLYSTSSHWGFALGVTQILGFTLGVTQILAFLDNNRLVSITQTCGVRGLKPIFHRKLGLRWLQNAKEINTKNMKCTCLTPAPMPGTQRHLYSTGNWVCVCYPTRRNLHKKNEMYMADARNWRQLTQNIPTCWYILRWITQKYWRQVYCPTPTPDARYFAFWWNIGFSQREDPTRIVLCGSGI